MVLINSLYVLPRHNTIIIYDNLQAQEIMRLNNKSFNSIYNIVTAARSMGFIYTSSDADSVKKWYLETKDTSFQALLYYNEIFSTTYYIQELEHYWLCPDCLSAVPNTWRKCSIC
jgi:hypothetical protein